MTNAVAGAPAQSDYDVIVVGAGIGGLYGVYKLKQQGLSVLGIEGGGDVGGVWYHNGYPGARVDVESYDYCYYFSEDLYREWKWSEKYARQPEILSYLNHVADRFDIRRHFIFDNWVVGAQWMPENSRYKVETSTGRAFTCRFLVMATGGLSGARDIRFPGLENFKGEWVMSSHWPKREVRLKDRRIGVIGTGSSGVQIVSEVAPLARHLSVFQRTPKFSVPAHNGPLDLEMWESIKQDVAGMREKLISNPGSTHMTMAPRKTAAEYTPEQQQAMLDMVWAIGGHHMQFVFTDQGRNVETNNIVADYARRKIRAMVKDPDLAEKLKPVNHPFGTRRLIVDTDYFDCFNRSNVSLVDVLRNPITRITETGIETADGKQHELDLIIFALGFEAFTGCLYKANVRNARGETPADYWKRGPRTLLGIMALGFPNMFMPTGPGSPSLSANLFIANEFHVDWIADCIAYMNRNGHSVIEPTEQATDAWMATVAETSKDLLRFKTDNYMVHVNEDGSRAYMVYAGGHDRYARIARDVAAKGYPGFRLS